MTPTLQACVERFRNQSTVSAAARFARDLTREIGAGFHPDTPFSNYVDIGSGVNSFSDADAKQLEFELERAWQVLDRYGVDIYRLCLPVQRALVRSAMEAAHNVTAR